jgi:hypothetical protein
MFAYFFFAISVNSLIKMTIHRGRARALEKQYKECQSAQEHKLLQLKEAHKQQQETALAHAISTETSRSQEALSTLKEAHAAEMAKQRAVYIKELEEARAERDAASKSCDEVEMRSLLYHVPCFIITA